MNERNANWHVDLFRIVLLFFTLVYLSGATCDKKIDLPDKSPTGMVLQVAPGTRTAPVAAGGIYKFVPYVFQPRNAVVRVAELESKPLAEKWQRDLRNPGARLYPPPYGLVGYTCFMGHDEEDPLGPDTIYLVPHRKQEDVIHTALHEWGHYTYWMLMTEGEREAWQGTYEKLTATDSLASGYESKGPQEQAAENFALWCVNRAPRDATTFFEELKRNREH